MSPELIPPIFNIDKSFNEIIERIKSQNFDKKDFNKLYVGITDVSKEFVDWKYRTQSKPLQVFESFPSKLITEKVYNKLLENGFQDLGPDELIYSKIEKCLNVFIVKYP